MATNQEIQAWLASNQGASDQSIARAMGQYGVSADQMSQATGMGMDQIQPRFDAASGMNSQINGWLGANPGASDQSIARAMSQNGITTGQMSGATGLGMDQVQSRFDSANGMNQGIDNWFSQNPNASDDYIASAMKQYGVNTHQLADARGMDRGEVDRRYAATQQPAPRPGQSNVGGGYGGFGGGPTPTLDKGYTANPYLDQIANGLRTQFGQFRDDGLAANRGAAVAAGGVGGSRQGIAEGRTMTDASNGFSSAIANLYGQDYQGSQNRNLQQYGMDQNYTLGQGGLANQARGQDQNFALGYGGLANQARGQDMNFYTQQRGQDQSGAALGAELYNQGMQGPWNSINNANSTYSPYSGLGNTTQNSTQGGGWQGGVGGALAGGAFGRQMNWW